MGRFAYLLRIADGKEEEYERAHQQVWPEMISLLRRVGFHNYSIYRHGLDLFVYVEVNNFDAALESLLADPVYLKWAEHMAPIMKPHPELLPGQKLVMLKEVFHVD